ncbi:LacI family DNA-binding transcriptional regulator [Microbacterium xanthum]|uniref:LacI family DNA-binding transcriptional regulator n=1 Tax=Microbacterium xanthum TaxID=3079794 RepID=UPI002AD49357|nr:LacI family DNA-binding transcriptional regulator [Microbacterium sp. KSW-48]MDZ8170684.1 LacI family DNA-binding transcriptional regulator [Microbacterium sp. KSW-48]
MPTTRPTVYDVAERAGVSIATVSFAFRRPDKVRTETREVVLQAAREIGYVPSGSARNLARGRTGVLGLHLFDLLLDVAPGTPAADEGLVDLSSLDLTAPLLQWDAAEDARASEPKVFPLYVDEVQRGFVLECRRNTTGVLLRRGGTGSNEIAETAGQVDGLAILPGHAGFAPTEALSSSVPVVMVSSGGGTGHHVLADNAGGVSILVEHLVTAHGVRSLGWVGAAEGWDPRRRRDAFDDTVADLDGVTGELIDAVDVGVDPVFTTLLERADSGTLPDALVCATDQTALAAIDVLRARGIEAPRDILIAGFDGIQATRTSSPTLTTVRQPMELMGRLAAHLLLTDPGDGSVAPRTVTVAVALQLGASCGCG